MSSDNKKKFDPDDIFYRIGKSNNEIADILGVYPQTVSVWRAGKKTPRIYYIKKLEELAGVGTPNDSKKEVFEEKLLSVLSNQNSVLPGRMDQLTMQIEMLQTYNGGLVEKQNAMLKKQDEIFDVLKNLQERVESLEGKKKSVLDAEKKTSLV